jgi:tetratricopeptide (TPR) repeat protein
MDLVRDHIAVKVAAAALAFLATFAAVRAIDGGPSAGFGDGSRDLSAGLTLSATTAQRIEALEDQVRQSPSDPRGYVDLGHAYLTRFGETEDPTFYPQAEEAFETALRLSPDDPTAVAAMAQLELSRHQFRQGLALAERARRLNPSTTQIDGLITDAQVELGRYGAAARTLQRYVDRRPELGSYARISYLRELHGDLTGAVQVMRLAAAAAGDRSKDSVFAITLLGKLYADQGDYAIAEDSFRRVLTRRAAERRRARSRHPARRGRGSRRPPGRRTRGLPGRSCCLRCGGGAGRQHRDREGGLRGRARRSGGGGRAGPARLAVHA